MLIGIPLITFIVGMLVLTRPAQSIGADFRPILLLWGMKVGITYAFVLTNLSPQIDAYIPTSVALSGGDPEAAYYEHPPRSLNAYSYPSYVLAGAMLARAVGQESLALALTALNLLAWAVVVAYAMTLLTRLAVTIRIPSWTLVLVLFVPNLIIYDATSSRDSLSASFLALAVLSGGSLIWARGHPGKSLVVFLSTLGVLVLLRPPLLLAALGLFIAFSLISALSSVPRPGFLRLTTVVLSPLLAFLMADFVNSRLTTTAGAKEALVAALTGESQLAQSVSEVCSEVEGASMTCAIRHSAGLGVVLSGAVRAPLATFAPLGSINLDPSEGSQVGLYLELVTSYLWVLGLPFIAALMFRTILTKFRRPFETIFWLPPIALTAFLGYATQIVHVRYRLSTSFFLFMAIWFGLNQFDSKKRRHLLLIGVLLSLGASLIWVLRLTAGT